MLYRRLKSDGYEVWIDEKSIIPGQDWKFEIQTGIRNANVIIFCLSSISVVKEGYVQVEIKEALEFAKEKPEGTIFIIPLRLDDCKVPESIQKWQWANYFEKYGYRELKKSLDTRKKDIETSFVKDNKGEKSEPIKEIIKPKQKSIKKANVITRNRRLIEESIFIDIHLYTGTGSSGKTTMLLNSLAYFANKDMQNNHILVLDETDNSDFSSIWLPKLRSNLDEKFAFRYEQNDLSGFMKGGISVSAYQPLPNNGSGFKWNLLAEIVESYIEKMSDKKGATITILIDTGSSIGTLIRNAGSIRSLNKDLLWRIIPWVILSPNNLINNNFLSITESSMVSFSRKGFLSLGNQFKMTPIYAFNPLFSEDTKDKGIFSQLSDFVLPSRDQLITIDTFFAYGRRKPNGFIGISEFFENAKLSFVEAGVLNMSLLSLDTYKVIGKTLNLRFVSGENKNSRYVNIFTFGIIDKRIAGFKVRPGNVRRLLENIRQASIEQHSSPVKSLTNVFGEIYNGTVYYLDSFYKHLNQQR